MLRKNGITAFTIEQIQDRFNRYGALYLLCLQWHSGQYGRGYRLLSRLVRAKYRPSLSVRCEKFETPEMKAHYDRWLSLKDTL